MIRKSGDHLLSVIEGTLDIARIESGKMTLETKPFDFPEFLQQIVGMFELQARNKGLGFHYEPVGELPAVVRADPRRLRQILRITSYNVCYTKLLRKSSAPAEETNRANAQAILAKRTKKYL